MSVRNLGLLFVLSHLAGAGLALHLSQRQSVEAKDLGLRRFAISPSAHGKISSPFSIEILKTPLENPNQFELTARILAKDLVENVELRWLVKGAVVVNGQDQENLGHLSRNSLIESKLLVEIEAETATVHVEAQGYYLEAKVGAVGSVQIDANPIVATKNEMKHLEKKLQSEHPQKPMLQ